MDREVTVVVVDSTIGCWSLKDGRFLIGQPALVGGGVQARLRSITAQVMQDFVAGRFPELDGAPVTCFSAFLGSNCCVEGGNIFRAKRFTEDQDFMCAPTKLSL